MFLNLYSGMEGFRCVIGENGYPGLSENGAGIHAVVYVMYGASAFGGSGPDGLRPGFQPRKSGQQSGMDVDDACRESIQQGMAHKAHKTGQADEVDSMGEKRIGYFLLGFLREFAFESAAIDNLGGDASLSGSLQNIGVRVVGEDDGDFRLQCSGVNGVHDGLTV